MIRDTIILLLVYKDNRVMRIIPERSTSNKSVSVITIAGIHTRVKGCDVM